MDEFEDDDDLDPIVPKPVHPWRRWNPPSSDRKRAVYVSKVTPAIKARIKELRGQGWTIRAICKEVGLSVQTVWKHT